MVHQVKKAWNETQATKTLRLSGEKWSKAYLALDGTDAVSYSQGEGVVIYPGHPSRYVEFDVTDAARNWLAGDSNYGLLLWATNEDEEGRDLRFYSKEQSSNKPHMTLACS